LDQAVFVTAQLDITGRRGSLLGEIGAPEIVSGSLSSPGDDLVLWRVIERAEVEKRLLERIIDPAVDGLSVRYKYVVSVGDGGLFPIEEPGHFKAELFAAFAHPSFLNEVGRVEIITSTVDSNAERGTRAPVNKRNVASLAQLEGRLVRRPLMDRSQIWYVEHGKKRLLESPTCGTLRFGDSWFRLIQSLPSDADADTIDDGETLTLGESAEGRILGAWPAPDFYVVQHGKNRKIINEDVVSAKYGKHWRIKVYHIRQDELAAIPDGGPIT